MKLLRRCTCVIVAGLPALAACSINVGGVGVGNAGGQPGTNTAGSSPGPSSQGGSASPSAAQSAAPTPTLTPTPVPSYGSPKLSLGANQHVGLASPVMVTIVDERAAHLDGAGMATISAQVTSIAEPAGETVVLTRDNADSSTYKGTISLERLFDDGGALRLISSNGKVGVYAEGGVASDSVTVAYSGISRSAEYVEPPSTISGRVSVGGAPVGGAQVQLLGATITRKTASRSDGSYSFYGVPPGKYQIVAAKAGTVQKTETVEIQ